MEIYKIDSDMVIQDILNEAQSKRPLIFYGAGYYGIMLRKYILENKGRDIDAFAVTRGQASTGCVDGKRVIWLDEAEKDSVFVVTVSEQKQFQLIENLKKRGINKTYRLLNDFLRYIKCSFNSNKLMPQKKLSFEVHLVDFCNLNCKGCYHFSPLASQRDILEIDEFKRDFCRMGELCGKNVSRVTLIGGEPLLHPRITDFIRIAKEQFWDSEVYILTNGTLLVRQDKEFWKILKKYDVVLSCTKYPIAFDYTLIEKMTNEYGVRMEYHNDVDAGEKMLIKFPFDINGNQDREWSFKHCWASNMCVTLKHGRIYTCPMAAHAHLLKDYFHLNLELSDEDYIDIYSAKSMEELTSFLIHPIPFCKYCAWKKRPEQIKWGVSEKKIEEWI